MKKAVIYSISVCLFSWAVFALVYFLSGSHFNENSLQMQVISVLYMFFPMIVALLMQLLRKEKPSRTGLLNFKVSWSWLVAISIPFAALGLSVLFSALMPGAHIHYGPEQIIASMGLEGETADAVINQFARISAAEMIFTTFLAGIIAGCTVNAAVAFGEEYGWRNYMVDALRGQKFWKAALLIGLVWGIWHTPLILLGHNYPQHPVAGVGMMCIFCFLMGILELYFVLKTGSVIPAAVMHGIINAIAGASSFLVLGGSDLTVGLPGVSGFLALATIIAVLWLYDRKHERILEKPIGFHSRNHGSTAE